MLQVGDASYLVARGRMLRWSFEGYAPAEIDGAAATLLTPPSTVRAFQAGYRPSPASKRQCSSAAAGLARRRSSANRAASIP